MIEMLLKILSPLRHWSASRAEMMRAAYTVQSMAVGLSLPILTIFVFISCRWFVELS